MWKRPEVCEPKFHSAEMMTEEEMKNTTGKGVGTCLLIGYACWTKGGFGVGLCYVAGTLN